MPETRNPFTVHAPDGMAAQDTVDLFVDVFSDFPKIPAPGHTVIDGPRGSGKSMMLRYLEPDCQMLARRCGSRDLPFWGVYVPIKKSPLKVTEMLRLDDRHASALINEHILTMYVAEKALASLRKAGCQDDDAQAFAKMKEFVRSSLLPALIECGVDVEAPSAPEFRQIGDCIDFAVKLAQRQVSEVIRYTKQGGVSPAQPVHPYSGALCGYLDFLYPMLIEMRKLPFMPQNVFLLIDDADILNLTQTRVLNTWLSCRTTAEVSIKATTQMGYKTYRTVTGQLVESPHDFSRVRILTLYTASPKARYRDKVRSIVTKRLDLKKLHVSPEEFFPVDAEQEAKIRAIADEYLANWEKDGKGARPRDDAYRYARPDYIRQLGGAAKSTSTYSYAGFDQLVHISSGIIRDLLNAAALMFGETVARRSGEPVEHIPQGIQDTVVRSLADELMRDTLDAHADDRAEEAPPPEDIRRLHNLISACGATFHEILLSDRSERRVFSIAISGELEEDVRRILRLGCELGYFHMGSIGNKEGTGRTRLYVLTRRLAPYFNLDPSSFAGYLFVTSDRLRAAMERPGRMLRRPGEIDASELGQLKLDLEISYEQGPN